MIYQHSIVTAAEFARLGVADSIFRKLLYKENRCQAIDFVGVNWPEQTNTEETKIVSEWRVYSESTTGL